MVSASATFTEASITLRPYVPRLVIDWLRETPDRTYRQVEGSLAFVDVSGFTNLTERLSRRGKVGAEEMNQILNDCFTECLSAAYAFGAGVIKWGGDAVLLLFDGNAHERRACRAAWEMQRTMRRVGRIRTESASVTLRMSIGIHSGLLDFFLVGDLHRELVVTGPAATRTVGMESIADAGEIALSPETAAALDPSDLGRQKEAAILLRRGPEVAGQRGETVEGVEALDLASCVPLSVREHLLAGGTEPEHRLMTAAFIHVMGADDLLASDGPDALGQALATTLDVIERTALEYGVAFFDSDIYLGGAKAMLMAGAPVSTGADEERMLRVMRAVQDADLPLPLRIGITRGRIFVGDFGPDYRRTYTVTGDSVNLAARLMSKAEPGQILATDDVLTHSRTPFQVIPLEPFAVKGKTEPVQASAVGAAHSRTSRRTSTPLVGREDELEILLQAFRIAASGSGTVVEIVAEPGMGKSRLIEELRARATPINSVSTECDEYETATPYHPFGTILRSLLRLDAGDDEDESSSLETAVEATAPHLMPFLPLLGVPLGIELPDTPETRPLEERFRKERVHEVTIELLGMLLLEPTLILFEDAHWMDEASGDLLRSLLSELDLRPWLIVITRREQASGFTAPAGSGATVIELQPLAPDQASTLLHATTAETPLLPHEIEALAERSGGNPLLLGELLTAARQAGGIEGLPDSIESLMTAQIDRLSPTDRRLLRSAAVIGTVFTAEVLAEALGETPDEATWSRLDEFLVDEEHGQRRFRHALLRDAAYEGLPYRRRRELHRRVGETIEGHAGDRSEDEAELLSLHFFHAHAFDKAWRYSWIAGARAASIYANVDAVAMLERAIESVRHLADVSTLERARVWETLGDVTLRLSEFDRSELAYRSARRSVSGSHVEEARLLQKEAMVPVRLGRYPNALRRLNRGWRRLEGIDGRAAGAQRARIFAWCGAVRQCQRRPQDTIDWCRRAIAEAEKTQTRDALAQAYFILDWAYLALGTPEQAGYSTRSIEIYEELGDLDRLASVLINLGGWAYLDGRWEESVELGERAQQALVKIGDRVSAALAAFNIAEIRADQGKSEGLEPALRSVLRVQAAAGNPFDVALTTSVLGRQLARDGRYDEAKELLETARRVFEEEGDEVELLTTGARTVECLVREGRSEEALSLADEYLGKAAGIEGVSVQIAMLHRLRGWSLIESGDLEAGRAALDESLRLATLRDENFSIRSTDYEAALTLDALAELGRLDGGTTEGLEDRRDAILERLGVVAIPKLPLPAGVNPSR
jgi:class 3 adenylate cyclase/tetratricopeptide (TPR) repeat protein